MNDSTTRQPLPFTPVPGRVRRDGWTPERQVRFIEALSQAGIVTAAARAVGMSAKSAYALLRRAGPDSGFTHAWCAALDRGYYEALMVALRDGVEGQRVPVFFGGRQVGEYRRFNTSLALAALRAAAAREEKACSTTCPSARADPTQRLHSALQELGSSEDSRDPRYL